MYGWIETGGFFAHTTPTDVVFRTATKHQCIALGNPDSNDEVAAFYVTSNQVGIHTVPYSTQHVLSVKGESLFYDGSLSVQDANTRIKMTGAGMEFLGATLDPDISITSSTSNLIAPAIYFDTYDSRIKCDSLVSDTILTTKRVLTGVAIYDVTPIQIIDNPGEPVIPGHEITIDNTYEEFFFDGVVFIVNKRTYYIWSVAIDTVGRMKLRISPYSKHAPTNSIVFTSGDTVRIDILEDWSAKNTMAKLEPLYHRFFVDGFNFNDIVIGINGEDTVFNGEVEVDLYFRNKNDLLQEKLEKDSLHVLTATQTSLSTMPQIVLKLYSIDDTIVSSTGQSGFRMRFRSLDGMVDLLDAGVSSVLSSPMLGVPKTVFMHPLTHYKTPQVIEDSVTVGYTIDVILGKLSYQLSNTRLASMTSMYGTSQLFNYGIDEITLGSRPIKNVAKFYKSTAPDIVVLDAYGVDDAVFAVMRQPISCTLKGIAIQIEAVTRLSDTIAELVFSSTLDIPNIQTYEGHYVHWIDSHGPQGVLFQCNRARYDPSTYLFTISISDASSDSTIFDSISCFYDIGRIVYIMPFKYTTHVRLGDFTNNVYTPCRMSIGTYKAREILTVKGDASVMQNLYIYNNLNDRVRENYFNVSYNNDRTFSLNGIMNMTPTKVASTLPFEVNSTVTATDFLKFSDARLKRDIQDTSADADLERMVGINVKTFKMHGSRTRSKGVIAQEIAETFPDAVSKVRDILPGTDQIAFVDFEKHCLRMHSYDRSEDLRCGCILRLAPINENTAHAWKHIEVVVASVDKASSEQFGDEEVIYVKIAEDDMVRYSNELQGTSFVQVVGIIDDVLLVNYEVLYMTAINAIKCLHKQVSELKTRG